MKFDLHSAIAYTCGYAQCEKGLKYDNPHDYTREYNGWAMFDAGYAACRYKLRTAAETLQSESSPVQDIEVELKS